jgi:probable rRNA maturation factor
MKVDIAGTRSQPERRAILRLIRDVARAERCSAPELSIVLVSNPQIRRLNRLFLGRNRATDVMAFPISDRLLGEIYVSRDQARVQAQRYKVTCREELLRLVLHGFLHLLGDGHRQMKPKYGRYLGGC